MQKQRRQRCTHHLRLDQALGLDDSDLRLALRQALTADRIVTALLFQLSNGLRLCCMFACDPGPELGQLCPQLFDLVSFGRRCGTLSCDLLRTPDQCLKRGCQLLTLTLYSLFLPGQVGEVLLVSRYMLPR